MTADGLIYILWNSVSDRIFLLFSRSAISQKFVEHILIKTAAYLQFSYKTQ